MTMLLLQRTVMRWVTHLNIGCALGLLIWLASITGSARAHGVSAGDLELDHPYAVPSGVGETVGKAYLRGIQNTGTHADRLLGASTPQATRVELQRLERDAHGMHSTPVQTIDLPAKTTVRLRHTGDYQLTLVDLKTPLKDGDRFDMTLRFAHAGSRTVHVWVQTPRAIAAEHASH